MKRLFIGLKVPNQAAKTLVELQSGVKAARFSPIENFHITLRFIGDLDDLQTNELINQLGRVRHAPFDIALKGVDFFGHEKPHSIHSRVIGDENINALAKKCESVCRKLGHEPDTRKYIPHVTLAYLGRDAILANVLEWQARHNLYKSEPWLEDKFYLYSSRLGNGPSHYEIEAEFDLIE